MREALLTVSAVAVALLTMLTVPVYAEETTIDVPFTIAEQECILLTDPDRPEFQAYRCWFTNEVMADDYQPPVLVPVEADDEPVQEVQEVAPTVEEEEAKPELTDAQKALEAIRNTLEHMEAHGTDDPAQLAAVALKDKLSLCTQGLEDTASFQPFDQWPIPTDIIEREDGKWIVKIWEPTKMNYDLRSGQYAKLVKFANWCEAQSTMMGIVSPDHYRNKVTGAADFQPYHGDKAVTPEVFPTQRLPANVFENEESKANSMVCLNQHFSDRYKADQGCPVDDITVYGPSTMEQPESYADRINAKSQGIWDEWAAYHNADHAVNSSRDLTVNDPAVQIDVLNPDQIVERYGIDVLEQAIKKAKQEAQQ